MFWKGRPVRNPRELLELCCLKGKAAGDKPPFETSGLMGSVLRAGEVRPIVQFAEDPQHEQLTDGLHISLRDITWNACYCSVFDECWLSDLQTLHPPTVQAVSGAEGTLRRLASSPIGDGLLRNAARVNGGVLCALPDLWCNDGGRVP